MVNLLEENQNCWICVFYHRVWRLWRINNERIGYEICHNFETEMRDPKDLLEEYFQLDVDLEQLYKEWASKCSYFRKLMEERGEVFKGIRILKQMPLEALFAFIFSANNNISRISKMVEQFCFLYGTKIDLNIGTFYDFPTFLQLSNNLSSMEQTLRKCGFGYRAKNIFKTVEKLLNEESIKNAGGAECWLKSLGELEYLEASKELQKLPGVGPKVCFLLDLFCFGIFFLVKNPIETIGPHK
uniref:DNA-(apurinic or apyrimidinic site) lyase n=1 Tax=Meloidogyne incognita TaxID=6306 RepID=A0A914NA94_MELIC